MKNIDKEKIKFFGKTTYKFCSNFKIKKPIFIKQDRRLKSTTAGIWLVNHKKNNRKGYCIKYNPEHISKIAYWKITYVILHELGHVKTKQSGNEFDNEYRAEKFAHDMIKKHFSLQYPRYCEYVDWYINYAKEDIYKKVFRKLRKN